MTNFPEINHLLQAGNLRQLRVLFRHVLIELLRTKIDDYIVTVNQAFLEMLGFISFKEVSSSIKQKYTVPYEATSFRGRHIVEMLTLQHGRLFMSRVTRNVRWWFYSPRWML